MVNFQRSIFMAINILCVLHLGWSQSIQEKEKKVLDDIMRNYDKRIRPTGMNGTLVNAPTTVSVNMHVLNIDRVDDIKMEYGIQVYLRQFWNDQRFKFSDMGGSLRFLVLDDVSKIWTPDIFIINEKQSRLHSLMKPNYFVRIFPNGNIMYSSRVSLTMACPMQLRWFPFDRQVCDMRLESYGWTTEGLKLMWKDSHPVDVNEHVNLQLYTLTQANASMCSVTTTTGEYSCLKLNLHLDRNFNSYLIKIFIPGVMWVVVSWLTFWLDHSAITARVVLGVTTLLALAYQIEDFDAANATVSYTRSIDVWTGVCMTFLFAALVEAVLVNYKSRSEAKTKARGGEEENPLVQRSPNAADNGQKEADNFYNTWLAKVPTGPKKLDILSRVIFPATFALFVFVYAVTNLAH